MTKVLSSNYDSTVYLQFINISYVRSHLLKVNLNSLVRKSVRKYLIKLLNSQFLISLSFWINKKHIDVKFIHSLSSSSLSIRKERWSCTECRIKERKISQDINENRYKVTLLSFISDKRRCCLFSKLQVDYKCLLENLVKNFTAKTWDSTRLTQIRYLELKIYRCTSSFVCQVQYVFLS